MTLQKCQTEKGISQPIISVSLSSETHPSSKLVELVPTWFSCNSPNLQKVQSVPRDKVLSNAELTEFLTFHLTNAQSSLELMAEQTALVR